MDIQSTIVSTKVHKGTLSADDLKVVALSYTKKLVGLTDDSTVESSEADVNTDGSITVTIVEALPAVPVAVSAPASVPAPAAEVPPSLS